MMTRTIGVVGGTSVQITSGNITPNIMLIEGYCNGVTNTQYFIQLHSAVPSSGVTVPLRSWQVLGTDGFTFNKNDIGLQTANLTNPPTQGSGYYIYLSSTDAVFTTPGITADINVDIEEYELEIPGTTIIGDTTTQVAGLTVFTSPNVGLKLYKAIITNVSIFSGNLPVFAFAYNPLTGDTSPHVWLIAQNATLTLYFGDQGLNLSGTDPSGVAQSGCYLAGGTLAALPSYHGIGSGYFTMQTWYK